MRQDGRSNRPPSNTRSPGSSAGGFILLCGRNEECSIVGANAVDEATSIDNTNAAFRYQAPSTPLATDGNKSFDVGWQWPLNDLWGDKGKDLGPGKGQGGGRWYAVGRLNYSLQDKKLTDGELGF